MPKQQSLDAREASLMALTSVEDNGAFVNLALADVLSAHTMDPRDKRLAAEITYGVMTYRLTLDWLIEVISGRPAEKLDRPILYALRIGFYQLFYLDRVPASAAVNSTVEIIKKGKKRALASFVNGVLRGAIRKKDNLPWPQREINEAAYLALRYAHPEWMVKRWLERFGSSETENLLAANNCPAPVSIRVNTLRTQREDLLATLQEQGLTALPSEVTPEGVLLKASGRLSGLKAFKEGLFQVQGESAMLTSRILEPKPQEFVLDGCSAPGGKTTHMAELMQNQGKIIALDIYDHRLDLVKANAKRLGIEIIETANVDARNIRSEHFGQFDAVLLDVPCSGLGVIRRKPDLKWRRSPEDIPKLALIQTEMLRHAAAVLKPGGRLVYSTCTNEPEETDEVIQAFLREHPDMVSVSFNPMLPDRWRGDDESGIHLLPHIHGVDGFFIVKLQKRRE